MPVNYNPFLLFAICKKKLSFESFLLLLYITSLFFDSIFGQVFYSFSPSSVIAFIFAAYSISKPINDHHRLYLAIPLVFAFILLLLIVILDLSFHQGSIFNQYYRSYFLNILFCSIMFSHFCNNPSLVRLCIKFIFATAIFISLFVCIGLFVDVSSTARVTLVGFNENYLGLFLLCPLILSSLYSFRDKFNFSTSILLNLPLFTCLLLTGTRSAYIAYILFFACIFLRYYPNQLLRTRLAIQILTLAFSCLLVSISFFPLAHESSFLSQLLTPSTYSTPDNPHIFDRLEFTESTSPLQLGGRLELWIDSLDLFRDNYFLGNGTNIFNLTNQNYHLPHNIFLEILVVGGIFALPVLLLCVFYSFYPVLPLNNPLSHISYISLLAPVITVPIFMNIAYFKFFWLFYALFLSFRFHLKRGTFC